MMEHKLTRRGFVAGCAGAASLAAVGAACVQGPLAFAKPQETSPAYEVKTVSGTGAARTGLTAMVADGRIVGVKGDRCHPYSLGYLSVSDFASASALADAERLAAPQKGGGSVSALEWDAACAEVAAALNSAGSGAVFLASASPMARYCAERMAAAWGSPNVFVLDQAGASLGAGAAAAIGYEGFASDIDRAGAVLVLGDNVEGVLGAAGIARLETAAERGAAVIVASPRYDNAARVATQWLPIKAGTELALVLAISNIVCTEDLYDAAFVAAQTEGFDQWRQSLAAYTPAWAASVCGIPRDQVETAAAVLGSAAPAASAFVAPEGTAGAGAPSGELNRAVALLNTALGSWNQPGGAVVADAEAWAAADQAVLAATAGAAAFSAEGRTGDDAYPLASASKGAVAAALEAANGASALVLVDVNPGLVAEAVASAPVSVAFTAVAGDATDGCTYALPIATYLEAADLPEIVWDAQPSVAMGQPAAAIAVEGARPLADAVAAVAEAAGCAEACGLDPAAVTEARLALAGTTAAGLAAGGAAALPALAVNWGVSPVWPTASSKVQFANAACEAAGLGACPCWDETLTAPEGEFALVIGEAFGPAAVPAASLAVLSERYQEGRLWVNSADADALGIEDGKNAVVEANGASVTVPVKVTDRIVPGAVFFPVVPVEGAPNPYVLVPAGAEAAYGGSGPRAVFVKVGKAGA